jgi:putative ABC transport system permease protein
MFVLRLAAREARSSWRRLGFFFLCVAVGVGSIIALRSAIQSIRLGLMAEARTLVGADVVIQTSGIFDARMREVIAERAGDAAAWTEAIEISTMARPVDEEKAAARMVELRAVQAGFPLYGDLRLQGDETYSHALVRNRGVLVRPELLAQLGVEVGDAIRLGSVAFSIRGVVLAEPGRALGGFNFGSGVLIDYDDLAATGLIGFGSRVRRYIQLRVDEPAVDSLVRQLRQDFRNEYISVRSYRSAGDRLGNDLERAENYLSLVGLVIVLLGGVGVWSVTRVFFRQKVRSIAVLKCLGANSRQVLGVYLLQVLALAVAGGICGVALAAAAIHTITVWMAPALPGVTYGLTASAVLQGLAVGVLVTLLFSLVPLLELRQVKPLLLLRYELSQGGRLRIDAAAVLATVVILVALAGIASWQAASVRVGLWLCAGFAGVILALHLAGWSLLRLLRPLRRARWFALRQAVLNLDRPGNQTRVILIAVGLGSFLILGVRGLQTTLLETFAVELRADGPDMFLVDIQTDQAAGVWNLLAAAADVAHVRLIPVLRARVTGVEGRDLNLERFEDVRERGSLGREYTITYRSHLDENERVIAGRFWTEAAAAAPEVSIEQSIRDRFGIQIGDVMRFDVLGRPLEATVTSVRDVDWRDARSGGFMFLFRPGPLDGAPHTYIAPLRAPADPVARARLQRDLVDRFPNVSAIDLREVLQSVRRLVESITFAVSVIGLVAFLSGALILLGSIAMTKFQRLYEVAVLKTLGATRGTVAAMLLVEYGTLGFVAGTIGSAAGAGLAWAVSRHVLDLPWIPATFDHLAGVLLTAVVVATAGVVASLDVLRRKPLLTLRAE